MSFNHILLASDSHGNKNTRCDGCGASRDFRAGTALQGHHSKGRSNGRFQTWPHPLGEAASKASACRGLHGLKQRPGSWASGASSVKRGHSKRLPQVGARSEESARGRCLVDRGVPPPTDPLLSPGLLPPQTPAHSGPTELLTPVLSCPPPGLRPAEGDELLPQGAPERGRWPRWSVRGHFVPSKGACRARLHSECCSCWRSRGRVITAMWGLASLSQLPPSSCPLSPQQML